MNLDPLQEKDIPQSMGGPSDQTAGDSDDWKVDPAGDDDVVIEELDDDGNPKPKEEESEKDAVDSEMKRIEKEIKDMTIVERLETSLLWKCEGNKFFKENDIVKSADCYYRAVLYSRDLTKNPKYYPNMGHTEEQREKANEFCETCFSNIALVQLKYASSMTADDPARENVLKEGIKSAGEALKINPKHVKALFRRAQQRAMLAKSCSDTDEKKGYYTDAKTDLLKIMEEDPKNREAHTELKTVQEELKLIKQKQLAAEKKEFAFSSTLSAFSAKEKDLMKDGTVKKTQVKEGDGGHWLNKDWLNMSSATKCVVHVTCNLTSSGGENMTSIKPVTLSFILGDSDMHEGFHIAVKSMTVGEVASFAFEPSRLAAKAGLVNALPDHRGKATVWELTFLKYVTWNDLGKNNYRLQKIVDEGYGDFPENLAEVSTHWRVFGPDNTLLHSSRYQISMGGEGGGMKQVEDEDKPPQLSILGEDTWEPIAVLCRSLRQGGVGELRMRIVPELPEQQSAGDAGASAQLSMMMNKMKKGEPMRHCVVRVELDRVVQPIAGPEDPRWDGVAGLVHERFRAEQLLSKGSDVAALERLRRVVAWAEHLPSDDAVISEIAGSRAAIGFVLVSRAGPILDSGNISSDVLAVANKDIAEAEDHAKWLQEHRPNLAGTHVLRAKILVAQDDDFAGAHRELLEAQKIAPDDKRVQEELRVVKVELRKVQELESGEKIAELRDNIKKARTEKGGHDELLRLLRQLAETKVSWDVVMSTKIGVELKACKESGGGEATTLCDEIIARFKDESKEQRPMWDS